MATKKTGTLDLFEAALRSEGITGRQADLARSIYFTESSGGKNTKTSNAGAVGGMQIIPSTFKSVADPDWDINDPMQNARAGIRYIKQLDKMSGGNDALTAAGYYGGPGGMAKARQGVPVYDPRNPKAPNTLEYGQAVANRIAQATGRPRVDAPLGGSPARAAPPQSPSPPVPLAEALASYAAPKDVVAQYQPSTVQPVEQVPGPIPQAPQQTAVAQPDPWQELIRGMGGTQPEGAVTPEQLAFGQIQVPQYNVPVPQARRPDFSAFGRWGAKV